MLLNNKIFIAVIGTCLERLAALLAKGSLQMIAEMIRCDIKTMKSSRRQIKYILEYQATNGPHFRFHKISQ